MSNHLGNQAVVVGTSIAGLTAARVLSDFFDRVILLDSDSLPSTPIARPGTPQSKHAHALLAGGQRALSSLFPGFEQDLVSAGAVPVRVASEIRMERPNYDIPQRDLGFWIYSMTRPLAESVVRQRVMACKNVEFRERCRALQFHLSREGERATVGSVACSNADRRVEQLDADLVIDASGHGSATLAILTATHQPLPPETEIGVDIRYATTLFEIPAHAPSDWKVLLTIPDPPRNRRGAFILPAEGNRWMVTLSGRYHEKPPNDWEGYMGHAKQIRTPTAYNAIRGARPTGETALYEFKASRWRHFERLETFPDGLLPIGDSICRFNPLYGQGMTVAAQEACLMQRMLAARATAGQGTSGLAREFFHEVSVLLETPWCFAAVPDFLDPLTDGERPADLAKTLNYFAAMFKLAADDPDVHRVLLEVQHLLKPQSAYREPALAARVQAVLAAMPAHFAAS